MTQQLHAPEWGQADRTDPSQTPSGGQDGGAAAQLLLSVEEAARRLGIRRTLMYTLMMSGEIRSIHVGRLRKVPAQALEAFVARRLSESEAEAPVHRA